MNLLRVAKARQVWLKFYCGALCCLVVMGSCNQSGHDSASQIGPDNTAADSLYKQVLALHDAAMPKMGTLIGYKKMAQQKVDSLVAVLKKTPNAAVATLKAQYENLADQLATAEKSMNEWMDDFDPDPKYSTADSITQYFKVQKDLAQQMKNQVFAAIDSAAPKLKP
jgi:hypothetical protein